MKKIKFYPGGQPFRSTDFELIQNNNIISTKQVLSALSPSLLLIILSGLEISIDPSFEGSLKVNDGYIFDGNEICQVSGGVGYGNTTDIYLRKTVQHSSPRLIAGSNKNIFENITYDVIVTTNPLSTDIPLSGYRRLDQGQVYEGYKFRLSETISLANSGSLDIYENTQDEVLLVGTYTHNIGGDNRLLFNLPIEYKPDVTVYGYYTSVNALKSMIINTDASVLINALSQNETINIYFKYSKKIT